MSRRFGRNQKRKMRAEMAHVLEREKKLNESYWREQDLMVKLSRDNDQLRETINLTEQVLGEYFVTLPLKTVEDNHDLHQCMGHVMLPLPDRPSVMFNPDEDRSVFLMKKISAVRAAVMRGDAWVDDLTGKMHIRFLSPAGDVAYAFGPKAFNHVPRERVISYLAKNMADFLTKSPEFKKFAGEYMKDKRS